MLKGGAPWRRRKSSAFWQTHSYEPEPHLLLLGPADCGTIHLRTTYAVSRGGTGYVLDNPAASSCSGREHRARKARERHVHARLACEVLASGELTWLQAVTSAALNINGQTICLRLRKGSNMRKIDAFAHILPRSYLERLERHLEKTMSPGQLDYYREGIFSFDPVLTDLDARWRKIEPYGDYAQILVLAVPPLEEVGPPAVAAEFARIANDEMAELVQRFPDRFVGFAAALPLNDVDEALHELDRALTQLGALGAQLYSNVLGVALDDPRFEPLFTRLEEAGRAVWLHPTRSAEWADYPAESRSDF